MPPSTAARAIAALAIVASGLLLLARRNERSAAKGLTTDGGYRLAGLPRDLHHAFGTYLDRSSLAHAGAVARRLGLLESDMGSNTTHCVPSTIGSVVTIPGQTACATYVWNRTSQSIAGGGASKSYWAAAGNIDPIYGSLFPWDNRIPAPTKAQLVVPAVLRPAAAAGDVVPQSYVQQQGVPLAPQVGWGGGPNVSLGPPPGATVWGVHATPSTAPGLASGEASVLLSWLMGQPLTNVSVGGIGFGSGGLAGAGGYSLVCPRGEASCPLGKLQSSPAPGAFVPEGLTFSADIDMGTAPGLLAPVATTNLTCLQYIRVHSDMNYLSPYICHVTVPNLKARTTYYYNITARVFGTPAVGPPAGIYTTPSSTFSSSAKTYKLNTPSTASTGCPNPAACGSVYPVPLALMADVGQTYNSSLTAQFLSTYLAGVPVQAVLNVGDFTYADDFSPYSTFYDEQWGTNPWKWDSWSAMWQPVMGQAMLVNSIGNHELEALPGQPENSVRFTDTSTSLGFLTADQRYPFQSYAARFPTGAQPSSSYGDLWVPLYYSQNLGPVHVITLSSYTPFAEGTEQYEWFLQDVAAVNRTAQPWLIVQFHVPLYHSYLTHYKEAECFRSIYEPLFYQYRVDIVVNGHVHAYERTHSVYNYAPDPCGPVYLVLGDGGNIEGPYRNFVDEIIPNSAGLTYCEVSSAGTIKAGVSMNNSWAPPYQLAAQPPDCPTLSFQPAQEGTRAGVVPNPYDSSGFTFWCQSAQPSWSAYRDPSFGFASLTLTSDTTATYSWYRSVDQDSGNRSFSSLRAIDTTTYTRYMGKCPSPRARAKPSTTAPKKFMETGAASATDKRSAA